MRQNISDGPLSLYERSILWLIPTALVLLQRIYALSLRRVDINREPVEKLRREGKAWIYSIWHTNALLGAYLIRGENLNVMISASRDGELIYRVVRSYGNTAVRGSTSKGGREALRLLIDALKRGHSAVITPDGPRGPAFKIQHGIVLAAMRAGVPIIPHHHEATRQWIVEKSWDQQRIPKPFSTVVVSYGDPIYVKENLGPEEFAKKVIEIEGALLENMRLCQERARQIAGQRRPS
jgi:hypothetical protein